MLLKRFGTVVVVRTVRALVIYCVGIRSKIVRSRLSMPLVFSSRSLCLLYLWFFLVQNVQLLMSRGILWQ